MNDKEQRITPDFTNDPKWIHEMCEELRNDIDTTIAQGTSFDEICRLKVGEYPTPDDTKSNIGKGDKE